MMRLFTLLAALTSALFAQPLTVQPLAISLPTENQHLFTGELDQFYMYVNRTFEGQTSQPWEAGSFGLVRSPIRVGQDVILTKFHEGIDIAPVKRDKAGNPLDLVMSIADGTVVHISPLAGRSNYGKYVVVEHRWENSSVYSLYAHLAEITCKPGDPVKMGSVLGRMGYTGEGIDRVRAHVHLELCLMLSTRYEDWHKQAGGGVNYQGLFNGMNLSGTEVARFFLDHRANPDLQFSQFVLKTPPYFKVMVPAKGTPDFIKRYPWICSGDPQGAVSWEIDFGPTGLPVKFTPSQREVAGPMVIAVRPSTVPHRLFTRGLITGEGNQAALTPGGKQLIALLMDEFPATPAP